MPDLLGGPEASEELVQSFADDSCQVLPEAGDDFIPSFVAPVATPILVIGVTGDNATPYQRSVELAADLGNAELLTLQGTGHTASFTGKSDCIDQAVTRYFLSGDLPPQGTICQ